MRFIAPFALVAMFFLQPGHAPAEPAAKAPAAAQPNATAGAAAASQPATAAGQPTAPLASRPEAWRYRWHNNYWWYYTPQNTWLYYTPGGWQAYPMPEVAYRAPSRSYRSYSTRKHVDPGHSLDTTGNYPRYWLWQRLGP